MDKSKLVNKHHAIKLIAEVPAVGIEARSVYCSGGDAALGHPKVSFLTEQVNCKILANSKKMRYFVNIAIISIKFYVFFNFHSK